jgi:hypothetical protein
MKLSRQQIQEIKQELSEIYDFLSAKKNQNLRYRLSQAQKRAAFLEELLQSKEEGN